MPPCSLLRASITCPSYLHLRVSGTPDDAFDAVISVASAVQTSKGRFSCLLHQHNGAQAVTVLLSHGERTCSNHTMIGGVAARLAQVWRDWSANQMGSVSTFRLCLPGAAVLAWLANVTGQVPVISRSEQSHFQTLVLALTSGIHPRR